MKKRLFVDMDGTLAVFQSVDTLETLYEEGYFANLKPQQSVVDAIREMHHRCPDIEIYIMSAVLSDSPYALNEKNAWLDKYLPEVDKKHRIFPPCGVDKKAYVPEGIRQSDYLLDDYTKNLVLWQPPAKGIKLLNGINHTKGTWKYDMVSSARTEISLANMITSIMRDGQICRDDIYQEKNLERPAEQKTVKNVVHRKVSR